MSSSSGDEYFMAQCLELASRGSGHVSPNPLVGAVIVKRGEIIGRGYHEKFGGDHAEIRAIGNAKGKVAGATLYVNLEPCSHFGKTPPCTVAIIARRIRRVVVGTIDPNPLVRGKGIRSLRSVGIEVRVGVLKNECKKLNEFFLKHASTGLPFIALKIAQTLDGKIAHADGASKWITSRESRQYVHGLRVQYDAVLIGATTARIDNPRLTVRLVKGRNPMRILLDGNLSAPPSSHLFTDSHRSKTIVFCCEAGTEDFARKKIILERRGIKIVEMAADRHGRLDLMSVLRSLASQGIISVLVEGGQDVFTEFLEQGLADKAYFFIAPKVFGCTALPAFGELRESLTALQPSFVEVRNLGNDFLVEGYLQKS